jgi:creatinine amidohydrolase/Fe(II)-dependent formamide hydrolase-like protein
MKYRFAEMIWYEIKQAAEQGRVAVLPVATYEDHGPQLPVDYGGLSGLTTDSGSRSILQT